MTKIVLIAHNIRSAHNIGSMMRTAEGLGIDKLFLTGFSPHPQTKTDPRPPHTRRQVSAKIHKTALGAEDTLKWRYCQDIAIIIAKLKAQNFTIAALEQTPDSADLSFYKTNAGVALIVGNEVSGLDETVLRSADIRLKIPMAGKKESFNVAEAAAMALYYLKYV